MLISGSSRSSIVNFEPPVRMAIPRAVSGCSCISPIAPLLERAFGPGRDGDWRRLPTSANRMPAAASYLRAPGDTEFRAFKLDVLRIEGDQIAEITTFGYAMFELFGLPLVLRD